MAQFARPEADISIGNWRRNDASAIDLWSAIDEATLDTADYVISGGGPAEDVYRVRLSDTSDPNNALSHTPRLHVARLGTDPVDLRVELFESNGRLIDQDYRAAVSDVPAAFNLFLDTDQRNAIVSYLDWELVLTRIEPAVWTNLGTDSVIAAETTTNAQDIRRLTWWDDKLWLGYGDVNAAVRPLFLRYWDSADSTIKTLASRSGGENTDGLADHFIWNDQLWALYQDPVGTEEYVVVSADGSAAVGSSITEDVVHAWMLTSHLGNLYIAGSGDPPASNGGCVWRSTDNGATWTQVFAPQLTGGAWITSIFSYGGFLWVQVVDPTSAGAKVGNSYKSADGLTWTDAGFQVSGVVGSPRRIVEFAGYAFIKTGQAGSEDNTVGDLLRFDGTGVGTALGGSFLMGNVYDLCVANSTLYVLSGGSRIFKSTDGLSFKQFAKAPVNGEAIEVNGQDLYFSADATIYRWTMP